MSVSNYKNNKCEYNIDKLEKVVYLINEDAFKNIHIDDGEAYVADVEQEPMALTVYNIQLSDTDELDERYKFTHTLTFSMKGYANYKDFEGRYYAIVKTVDGEYWLVNPMFPCKVTYTYTLDANDSHTDFTMATISNHPTLRIHGMNHATPYECGYQRCTFGSLRLNESMNSLLTNNHVLYTNDGFKDVEYNKNSAVFTETFDGKNIQHKIDFNIKFDDYKSSWHYNLLEFTENRYAAIIETSCNKFILVGFHFGLQPSFTVTANDEMTMDNILISLVDSHDNGTFISYLDDITIEKDGTTQWVYTNKYNGYECVGSNLARYLLMEEVDALMNPTGNYKVLAGYESQFTFLNIVGTFTETETFNSYDCSDNCRMQSSFPLEFVFNNVTCREYDVICDSDWSITSSAAHITVSPSTGVANQAYTVQICNTLTPSATDVTSNLTVNYCNRQKVYNVIVKQGDSCLPAGSVFDISANGQYVTIPTSCCVQDAKDFGGTITNITIQNTYIRVYVPQNNTGEPRQFIIAITYCDGTEGEAIINQGTGFERWVKEGTGCSANQKCDIERKYTGTTIGNINTRTEETRYTNCAPSSDCGGVSTRWIDSTETTCSGGKKYSIQFEQTSTDGGETWINTGNKRLGDEVPDPNNECAGVEEFEDWRENGTVCDGTTKYNRLQLYVSVDQINWVATNTYKRGDMVIETDSADCGYIIPSTGWTCDKWETADGYICEGTTKYAREQWYVRNCSDCNNCGTEWIATGVYRRTNTVLETNSADCGYIKGSDEWTCEKWEVVQNDYICEDGTKYTKERRYVRDCEDCSDCSTPWVATDAYRRGSTVIEVNSADCGYIKGSDEWTCDKWETSDGYICEETTKYAREQRYVRECEDCNNCEAEWIATGVYRRTNTVLEINSTDCGYVKPSTAWTCSKWEVVQNDYICEDGTKYTKERRYVRECENCNDCSAPWIPTDVYRRGSTVIEENSTDCGYDPTVTGNCTEYRDEGDTICDGFDKYKYLRKYVRECEDCSDCSAAWVATNIYKRGALIQANSVDCGYIPTDTYERWVEDGYMCDGYSKYKMLRKEISEDNIQWYRTSIYKRGDLIENNSTDCGYIPSITGNCTDYRDEGDTICDEYNKYKYLRKYVRECENCNDCSAPWVATNIYKRGALIQANSIDCGYIPTDTYTEWRVEGTMCNGYNLYYRERKYISDDGNNWYQTNIYKQGSLIEEKSLDCGYTPPNPSWLWDDWRIVETDFICEDGNKYEKLRRWVSNDQVSSKDQVTNWTPTDVYKRGELLEENSGDCGYDPSITGNCSEYRDEGDTICDGFDKYKYLRKYVRQCINCDNCDTAWQQTNIYKRGDKIQEHSLDCGYVPSDNYYEWREVGWDCDGYDKYKKYRKYISEDGNNWYETNIYKLGDTAIEVNSVDCGYVERIQYEYRWVESDNTRCVGYNKYKLYKKQRRRKNLGGQWEDVVPTVYSIDGEGTMPTILVEADSEDCGYVPPVEPRYRWVTMDINKYWICADCDDTPDELAKIEYRLNEPEATVQSAACDSNTTLVSSDYGNQDIVYAKVGGCITTIGDNAFSNKISLAEALLPSTVTTIGAGAFSGCTSLVDFSLPMSVTSIGANAFNGCIQLNKIMLPNSLTLLGNGAFYGCKNFPSINIPEGITIIPTACFYDCDGMTDIYLPENVRLIQSRAFGECSGLVNFTCNATEPPAIYQDTFSNMNENLKIYVPATAVDAYKLAWSAYADKIVAIGD